MDGLGKRFALAAPTWLVVAAIVFLLVHLVPGDPASVILGVKATPDQQAQINAELGLDRPLPEQFVSWLGGVLHGDLGDSLIHGKPVATAVWEALGPSVELVLYATLLAIVLGIPIGVIGAVHNGKVLEFLLRSVTVVGLSIPSFVLGSLLILFGSMVLPGVQMVGYVPLTENPVENLTTMFWPAITLALSIVAVIARYTRTAMLEELGQDYVVTARAMGVSRGQIVYRNVLKNALLPVVGATAAQVAYLIGGAIVVEAVFAIPGIGLLTLEAIGQRDYPVVQGVTLVVATGVILFNIGMDVVYRFIDPRLSHA